MNIYQPHLMRIREITDETVDTRTLKLEFQDSKVAEEFQFSAGQFGEYSVFGEGESTFCIASPPTRSLWHCAALLLATPWASADLTETTSRSKR
jgi:NAD(P)H-flavin reductase